MKKSLSRYFITMVAVMLYLPFSDAVANLIDLNSFVAFPSPNIVVNGEGSSATFSEDIFVSPVSLENYSFSVPDDAVSLNFDYELTVAVDNEDYFDFYLGDITTPLFSVGGFVDSVETSEPIVWANNFSTDLSTYVNSDTNVIFSMQYGWDDWGLDSILTISNLNVIQETAKISEPSSIALLFLGFVGWILIRRQVL